MDSQFAGGITKKLEIVSSVLLLLYLLGSAVDPALSSAIKAVSYPIVGLLIILQWKRFAYVSTRDIPLLLLVVLSVASVLWSASPDATANEIKALARSSLFGAYFATRFSIKEQMQLLIWVFSLAVVLSLIAAVALPDYGTHVAAAGGLSGRPWKGIFDYKNTLAAVASLAAMLFLCTAFDNPKQRLIALLGVAVSVILIVFSQSKTGLVVFIILLLLLPLYQITRQQYKLQVLLYLPVLLLAGSLAVLVVGNWEFLMVDILGKDVELNGRTPIWTLALEKGMERPWLGYGYVGFWTSDDALYVINNTWAGSEARDGTVRFNSHNGFLELFLQGGGIGFFLYVISLVTVFIRVAGFFNLTKTIESFWMLQTLVAIFLFNLTDAAGLVSPNSIWIIYISIALSTIVERNRLRKAQYLSTNPSLQPSQTSVSYPIVTPKID